VAGRLRPLRRSDDPDELARRGTYRIHDGRGGAGDGGQRFAPLNSWPDNANLDKARRLLWPVKQKYGQKISWADLLVLAGNVALESMGFKTFGFGFGRQDVWEPEEIFWGPEDAWLGDERYVSDDAMAEASARPRWASSTSTPRAPRQRRLRRAAHFIRETFARMAMNDEETVALIAGGHTFGKTHGAGLADDHVGPGARGRPAGDAGPGLAEQLRQRQGRDTITSGLEVTWTDRPTQWSNRFFEILFGYEWELTTSPGGAKQWVAKDAEAIIPDAHDPARKHKPTMLTTDLSLRFDPAYEKISRRFLENPDEFALAFAKAWYKLLHRDMGPVSRFLGPWVAEPSCGRTRCRPSTTSSWVTPTSPPSRRRCWSPASRPPSWSPPPGPPPRASGPPTSAAAPTAPGSGSSRSAAGRSTSPSSSRPVLDALEGIQREFNEAGGAQISLADLIVLAGSAAVEKAARDAGVEVTVPFRPGRTDATQEQTDVESFRVLEPRADGFRNYLRAGEKTQPEVLLVDRAYMLNLTAPR
jgi:catalase-peroxidase